MAELVDAPDLESGIERCKSSNLFWGTNLCSCGETGRRKGLKLPWFYQTVRVQIPSRAPYAPLTQLVEYLTFNQRGGRSNLSSPTMILFYIGK